jgi:hypothetical protein
MKIRRQRIEMMPGHTEKNPQLHMSAYTKRPAAMRRLDRRAKRKRTGR